MGKVCDVGRVISTNLVTLGHQTVLFALKTCQVLAGWTVKASSDETTFNAIGDQITHAGTGAGGLSNHNAWYVIEEPGGRRQWCVQSSAIAAMQVRLKSRALAKFIGGTPTAQRVPSATDERATLGIGTDAAPAYQPLFSTGGLYRIHIIALSHAIGGAYGFYMFCTPTASANAGYGLWFQEPMLPGTYSDADGNPVVIQSNATTAPGNTTLGWLGYGSPGQLWVTTMLVQNHTFSGSVGTELGAGSDVNVRPWWTSLQSGAPRIKGCSAVLAARSLVGRAYPATLNRATDAYVYLDNWLYPYPNDTEPSIA